MDKYQYFSSALDSLLLLDAGDDFISSRKDDSNDNNTGPPSGLHSFKSKSNSDHDDNNIAGEQKGNNKNDKNAFESSDTLPRPPEHK
jgi:hypothetical protein